MYRPIVVVDADEEQCLELCSTLEREKFRASSFHTLADLEGEIEKGCCWLAILDLDSLPVNNKLFRRLKKTSPALCIIGLSRRPFHPELEEAMSTHIYACLGKPVDEEDLVFLVKSLGEKVMAQTP